MSADPRLAALPYLPLDVATAPRLLRDIDAVDPLRRALDPANSEHEALAGRLRVALASDPRMGRLTVDQVYAAVDVVIAALRDLA